MSSAIPYRAAERLLGLCGVRGGRAHLQLCAGVVADLADRFLGIVIIDRMPGMGAARVGVAQGLDPG
ncbi:hypothetical protein [Roseovarius sp. A-2]|uniref:hypothetical protein n=1 Tax=Roseovarius sp. A-2 TaxID=1570360 RepID=UPI0020CB475D|nr:hypothetical protein [Roseovarius sp. A-2]